MFLIAFSGSDGFRNSCYSFSGLELKALDGSIS